MFFLVRGLWCVDVLSRVSAGGVVEEGIVGIGRDRVLEARPLIEELVQAFRSDLRG